MAIHSLMCSKVKACELEQDRMPRDPCLPCEFLPQSSTYTPTHRQPHANSGQRSVMGAKRGITMPAHRDNRLAKWSPQPQQRLDRHGVLLVGAAKAQQTAGAMPNFVVAQNTPLNQGIRTTISPDTYGRYPVVSPIILRSIRSVYTKFCDGS
eukprot:COSAG01_NODE_2941_length_6819_cov_55.795536_3_plen_152_part_00